MGLEIVINDKPNKHREKQDEHPRHKTGGNSEFEKLQRSPNISLQNSNHVPNFPWYDSSN